MLVGDPIARISRDQKFQIHFFPIFIFMTKPIFQSEIVSFYSSYHHWRSYRKNFSRSKMSNPLMIGYQLSIFNSS